MDDRGAGQTATPRAASSTCRPRIVRGGSCASRASAWSATGAITSRRLPPVGLAVAEPVARSRIDHFTTADALTPNRPATRRTVSPGRTAATTRPHGSIPQARVIHAGHPFQSTS